MAITTNKAEVILEIYHTFILNLFQDDAKRMFSKSFQRCRIKLGMNFCIFETAANINNKIPDKNSFPYCMIHFGKPMPESLAAIIAGVVLGFLSIKNNSIVLGFLIHCSVGMAMDMASLWNKGFLQ
jgi:hypothetical protein